jgi:F-type H+-transporting ATPase subunit b
MMSLFISSALAAGAADAAGGGSSFPPFDVVNFPGQIAWLTVTFGALYLLMSRVALPRMSGIMEARAARIDGDLKAATIMQEKARASGEAYEKLLADAKANAQATGQKAKDEASAASAERRKVVEAEMSAKVATAEAGIASVRDKALGNVASIAVDAATDIVKRITKISPSADVVKKAVASVRGGA